MQTYVVTHPDAVVVEFVTAPVAPLAVFCVLQNVRVANFAKEMVVLRVEIDSCHLIFQGHSCESL